MKRKILIVSATQEEVKKCQEQYGNTDEVDFLITGVGIPSVILKLSKLLQQKTFELVINAGIAGAFSKQDTIGNVYQIHQDAFADIGFQNAQSFIPLSETPFKEANYSCLNQYTDDFLNEIPQRKGITVNSSSGNKKDITIRQTLFSADTESMEGAAVLYTCQNFQQACVQIRSISNYIEERNPEQWNIPLAIKNLNETLSRYLDFLLK